MNDLILQIRISDTLETVIATSDATVIAAAMRAIEARMGMRPKPLPLKSVDKPPA